MTEPRIDAILAFLDAERRDLAARAGELVELGESVRRTHQHVAEALERLAAALACKVPVIDRLIGPPDTSDAEITQPIVLEPDSEICTRCHGTGEVPAL